MAILNVPIQVRIDNKLNWNNSTLILKNGEPALCKKEDGTYELKFGDGQKTYKELPIFGGNQTEENNSDLLVTLTSIENNQANATYEQIKATINNKHLVAVIYKEEVYMLNEVFSSGEIEFKLNKSQGQKYLEISSSNIWYENSSSWQAINISINKIEGLEATNVQEALTELKEKDSNFLTSQEVLEKNIKDYYAMRRTGKVYQTRFWKFEENPSSLGEKLLDNANLIFQPSTDNEEGQDDYLNGQNPLFEWVNVNYIRDADGSPRPIAIEGQENYKTFGAVDVGVMQMSFWYKIDSSDAEYIYYTISDTPHPELELMPWPECVTSDGTILPWCIASKYISGIASDGLLRSQPNLKPARKQSHNNMILEYQKKGEGYWGAGAVRNTFQILFNAIKCATKSSQAFYSGTTSYSFQYAASVQQSTLNTYFPVTNSQANNIIVGGYVSVGYGYNNNGTITNDRSYDSIHSYADDVQVLKIETLDENNKAVYLDIEEGFSTLPIQFSDTLSAEIILSSMHWWSGSTDRVRGHHDGSLNNNTNGKYPYRVQGREYSVGGYIVASDTVAYLNEDNTRTIYTAPKGISHITSSQIATTYSIIGTIPAKDDGTGGNFYIGDCAINNQLGTWYPSTQGTGSAQGVGDYYYAGGTASNTYREYLMGGYLWNGSHAGSCFLNLRYGLGDAAWYYLASD